MTAKTSTIWALDVAFARGIPDLEYKGKKWTFAPLKFKDWADIVALVRSEAVASYLNAIKDQDVALHQQTAHINAILFGSHAQQHSLEALRTPAVRKRVLRKSLEKAHPDVTDEQLDEFLEEENTANMYADIVELISLGPVSNEALTGEAGPENPTDPQSDTTKSSKNSLENSDIPSTKSES